MYVSYIWLCGYNEDNVAVSTQCNIITDLYCFEHVFTDNFDKVNDL